MKHFFSIITVCKNASDTILRNMESVQMQNFQDYEHILIDGKSTDNTWENIISHCNEKTKVFCESDTGIYNAMNKGIKKSNGRFILFLNADDYFYDEKSLKKVSEKIETLPQNVQEKLIFSSTTVLQKRSGKYFYWKPRFPSKKADFYIQNPHPSLVLSAMNKREIYFNENFIICADLEQQLRLIYLKNYQFISFDMPTVIMTFGGVSTKSRWGFINSFNESKIMFQDMFNRPSYIFSIHRIIRKFYDRKLKFFNHF